MSKSVVLCMSALVLSALSALAQNQSPLRTGPADTTVPSKVACSDSSTILPAKRSPEACAESDFALYGRPVMFAVHNGIAHGVSVAPDKPGSVTIWMENQTDQQQNTGVCCNATFVRYIDLYDQSGQRIPSKLEIGNAKSPLADPRDLRAVPACGCSGWVAVPPHSLKVIDRGELNLSYTLSSGRYTIVEYPPHSANAPEPTPSPTLPPTGSRLVVLVP